MVPTNLFRASILLYAALGLVGCGGDSSGDNPACPIGSHDGGDGTCVPEGSCSEGHHGAGSGTCVSNKGPCPAGFATSGKNDLCCAGGYHDGGVGACVAEGICSPGYVENEGGECAPEPEEPPGPPQIDAPVYVTAGESYTASVTSPVATSAYTWDISGGVLEAGTGASVTFTAGSSGTITLSCFETNRAGMRGEAGTATSFIAPVPDTVPIAAGESHTCVLTTDGGVQCWGDNSAGQLGNGTAGDQSSTPVAVTNLSSGVAAIAAGDCHTCALTTDNGVRCWGANSAGQLGNGTTGDPSGIPVEVTDLSSGVVAIAAGEAHTCALMANGGVRCWGANGSGQLGNSTGDSATPVAVTDLSSGVAAIAAGDNHTCALTTDGGVRCWGANGSGQLGYGTTGGSRSTPVKVANLLSGVAAIAAGGDHTCALTTDGGVRCWGYNYFGQLGNDTTGSASSPMSVTNLSSRVAAIAAGDNHTCALTTDSGARCWGFNYYGQLGSDTTSLASAPVEVTNLSSAVAAVAAGDNHTCALTSDGGIWCWGHNRYGQLGIDTPEWASAPVEVTNLSTGVAAIAAGTHHTCALTTDGAVRCWGDNYSGELGNGTPGSASGLPVEVTNLSRDVAAIAPGGAHTCVLTTDGGVWCWGDNFFDQLGNRTAGDPSGIPVEVTNLSSGVAAIAAGHLHTCALTTDNGVRCWGANGNGQLGIGTTGDPSGLPVDVTNLSSGVVAIATGDDHTCALTADSGAWCWGTNYAGQLGDGAAREASGLPVEVTNLSRGVVAIATGYSHTCALTTYGGVRCWGANSAGQLGDGTTGDRSSTPVEVMNLSSGVAAITAGGNHTCALTTDGDVWCWGSNYAGQLGNGATPEASGLPVKVANLSRGVAAIAAGRSHTCALTTDGGVRCWGDNEYGQLGNGTTGSVCTPVKVTNLSR